MRYLVTGGAGFIGSNLVDRLLKEKHEVLAFDNLSTGQARFLEEAQENKAFTLLEKDLLKNESILNEAMDGVDTVFHLSANADVRFGTNHPTRDLEQNTIATSNVLEAMRKNKVKKIVFSSTGSIYGEPEQFPTPESAMFPVQTSLYGASKLACEGLIAAYCEGFDMQAWVYRFVSVLGQRYSHGHVIDFYKQLQQNPKELKVLGDGHQKKSYMDVTDCIDGILCGLKHANEKVNIFNLGTEECCEVNDSISWITSYLGLNPKLNYAGGKRGWIGDSPFILLDTTKIQSLGWKPKHSIQAGVERTLRFFQDNPWVTENA